MDKRLLTKLRRKFVFTNMLLVFLVLATVFTIVSVVNFSQAENQVYSALERSSTQFNKPDGTQSSENTEKGGAPFEQNESQVPPRQNDSDVSTHEQPPDVPADESTNEQREMSNDQIVAVSTYELNDDGEVELTVGDSLQLDDSVLNSAIKDALSVLGSQTQAKGFSDANKLYYNISNFGGRTIVSFASQNYVYTSMTSLFVNLGLSCLAALVAFFVISFFLAKWALRPVEKAWTQQTQFVADASHELKTPLTVILANMSILKKEVGKNKECEKWISSTESEVKDMQVLVEDMLELAKAESQQTKALFCKVDFSKIVESCALHFESVAFENGGEIVENVDPKAMVFGDESQLKRLVSTLIENACKYSNNLCPIKITLKNSVESCELAVANSSGDISDEELDHMFDRFYKADKARTGQTRSYGLGLAIAREIVNSHKGKISVKNETGITTFTVTFPRV